MGRVMRGGPAIWLALLAGFVVLCAFAAAFDRFPGDLWLAERLQDVDSESFAHVLDWTEDLTDVPLWIAVWLGATAALFATGHTPQALILLASAAGRAFNPIVKEIVGRPRPADDLVSVIDVQSSPPSPAATPIPSCSCTGCCSTSSPCWSGGRSRVWPDRSPAWP